MSLPVLVAIVAFGIALSVAAVHFTGGSRTAMLVDADQALRRFAEDFPDEVIATVRLTADARTAFLDLGRGRTGIVHGVGDCFLTRIVASGDVTALNAIDPRSISLRLADFTWKGGQFVFSDADDAGAVMAALKPQAPSQIREAA
ncbi:hypothetical protein LGH82_01290 [Mesorhizobium sp. PAMC28654]|uniref:hypothetical protein n=1 Tax=Mesorhizobium sp. PAMC28654 TaxID=2880934 RepID=UPI001D0ACE8E|nr:hypothetical protein [Mesorhizobium sp. PAMC28654]UDL90070.1 hypothetical protein LGH82_01290 [Mesorhizobium sp. PAMC28654]